MSAAFSLDHHKEKPSLFIFGLGFTGLRFAVAAKALGYKVYGTVRSMEKAQRLSEQLDGVFCFDQDNPLESQALEALAQSEAVLNGIPCAPDDPVYLHHHKDLAQKENLRWFAYLSTTVVYGDWDGACCPCC